MESYPPESEAGRIWSALCQGKGYYYAYKEIIIIINTIKEQKNLSKIKERL